LPILLNLKINKRNKTGYMDSLLSHVSPEYLTVDPIPAQKPYQPYQAPVRENRSRTGKAEFVNSINGFPAIPINCGYLVFSYSCDGWLASPRSLTALSFVLSPMESASACLKRL
jgi:hypothetical protein